MSLLIYISSSDCKIIRIYSAGVCVEKIFIEFGAAPQQSPGRTIFVRAEGLEPIVNLDVSVHNQGSLSLGVGASRAEPVVYIYNFVGEDEIGVFRAQIVVYIKIWPEKIAVPIDAGYHGK